MTQGIISSWLKAEGDFVEEGGDLLELETDKANVTVPAPATGVVSITVKPGTEVSIGQVVGFIDSEGKPAAAQQPAAARQPAAAAAAPVREQAAPQPAAPQAATVLAPPAAVASAAPPATPPAAAAAPAARPLPRPIIAGDGQPPTRTPMTSLRKRTAQKLLEAQHSTASLSTFNEVNMKNIMDLRARYREEFERIHGVKLGFTSFFVKASCRALSEFPMVNARIDGEDIVYFSTYRHRRGGLHGPRARRPRDPRRGPSEHCAPGGSHRRPRLAGPRPKSASGRACGRLVLHHQRRSVRFPAFHSAFELSAVGHPGHARHPEAPRGRGKCRGERCRPSHDVRGPHL